MECQNLRQYPKNLPGSFWGLTSFFNPSGYKNKLENYYLFRESSKQQGLNLITIECAFENDTFKLKPSDADILIQVRSDSVLWQKERLLNIALENLPSDCDKIAWIDCDILFLNDNWVSETSKLLEKYIVVKPFNYFSRIGKKVDPQKIKTEQLLFKFDDYPENTQTKPEEIIINKNGHPGFVCAARREIFRDLGFYDKMIIGGADKLMQCAFTNDQLNDSIERKLISKKLSDDSANWRKEIYKRVNSSYYFKTDKIIHLYHGAMRNRAYLERYSTLKEADFDPDKDLQQNKYGCFEWASAKKDLHAYLKMYFDSRNENDHFFYDLIFFIKYKDKRRSTTKHIIGQIGILIKKISPKLYSFLNKKISN